MEKRVLEIARIIHIAKLKSVCCNDEQFEKMLNRQPFPEISTKEFRELNHHGQSWIEIAKDQAKAVVNFLDSEVKDVQRS